MNARALVLAALRQWRAGERFADAILQELLLRSRLSGPDRAFATELFYGALRHLTLLDFWIEQLRAGPLDPVARDLLRLGLYQLFFLRTPGHAAVFETVALAGARRRALVNGVLRSAQRRQAELESAAQKAPLAIRESHPQFLIDRWQAAYGVEAAEALCRWNNQPAEIYARVNRLKTTPDEFFARHEGTARLPEVPNFVRCAAIPHAGLEDGECYVQDPSTRLACELLAPQPGESVLDACAAPGGKTAYLAEMMQNRGQLNACDRDPRRIQTLRENLDRLGATIADIREQDWLGSPFQAEAAPFDRILLDAPCTNTGVMRRRVDVRWRLRPDDFAHMAGEQLAILRALVPLLKAGGTLVYSTCSIEPEENEGVVSRALELFPTLKLAEQRALLPFRDGFDGAFAARLVREG